MGSFPSNASWCSGHFKFFYYFFLLSSKSSPALIHRAQHLFLFLRHFLKLFPSYLVTFKTDSHKVTKNIWFLCLPPFSYSHLFPPCYIHTNTPLSPILFFGSYFSPPLKSGAFPQYGKYPSCSSPSVSLILLLPGTGALLFSEEVSLRFMPFELSIWQRG